MQGGFKLQYTERFKKDFRSLSPDLQRQVEACVLDLARDPIPATRRPHRINTAQTPKIFSVDVTPNKSHKLSFHIEGDTAWLRRVGTHKQIDRQN